MCAASRPMRFVLLGWVVLIVMSTTARAQTGAALLLKPWPSEQSVESDTDGYFLNAAHTKTGESLQLSLCESYGRLRLQPGNLISPRLGYELRFLDTNLKSGIVPRELTDLSIALGTAVGEYHGWTVGATAGVGYAGDSAFSLGSAWYGKATIDIGKQITDNGLFAIIIDYDGNRPYLPDIPLPGIAYKYKFDDTLLLLLGAPYSSIEWTPMGKLKFVASYRLFRQFTARLEYRATKRVLIYGGYDYEQDAFHIAELGSKRRLLFSDQRVETGLEYSINDQLMFRLAAGYAFDNRFARGFDFDKTNVALAFSDEPYVHLAFEMRF